MASIQSSYQLSVELFQRQFIFRYFKNSFKGDFYSMALSLCSCLSHVAPDVSQSPFLGSQHSFDLILRAICNPLQDIEARSPQLHTSPSHFLSFCSTALSGLTYFSLLFSISITLPHQVTTYPLTSICTL